MATWGTGPFEGDVAMDLVTDITHTPDAMEYIDDALERPEVEVQEYNYVECDICERAIAAASVVLALSGSPPDGTPDAIVEWSRDNASELTEEELLSLRQRALRALEVCEGDNVECLELWGPLEGAVDEWRDGMDMLKSVLKET